MKLNITDIINVQGAIKQVSMTKETFDMPESFSSMELQGPIRLEGELESDRGNLYLSGILTTEIKVACDRCMGELIYHIESEVTESFGSIVQSTIDLHPTIVETLLVSLPMKVLCNEECKGMCTVCGQNLNEQSCDCDLGYTDPRLEKLELLFKNSNSGENNKEV